MSRKNKKELMVIYFKINGFIGLFNLRGNDIPFNPVFKAYAVVSQNFTK